MIGDAIKVALVEEFERALVEFVEFIRHIPDDMLDVPVPGEEGSIRAILAHVVGAGYRHIDYVADLAGAVKPARRFTDPENLADMRSYAAAVLDVARYAREALGPVQDASLEGRFKSRWGQEYDGEQMMEHAICHPGRHMRQLRRLFDGEI
jgi:hypothetical protein